MQEPSVPNTRHHVWLSTFLSPTYTIRDWYEARDDLRSDALSHGWTMAIEAIQARFNARVLAPIDAIQASDAATAWSFGEGGGFAIVALDCLLIDMIHAYEIAERTERTRDTFIEVLTKDVAFDPWFRKDGVAASFARAVRNSVLHDGETREGWLVWQRSARNELLEPCDDGCTILYRDDFHEAAKTYMRGYFSRLSLEGAASVALRDLFKQRVDQLAVESHPAFVQRRHVVLGPGEQGIQNAQGALRARAVTLERLADAIDSLQRLNTSVPLTLRVEIDVQSALAIEDVEFLRDRDRFLRDAAIRDGELHHLLESHADARARLTQNLEALLAQRDDLPAALVLQVHRLLGMYA